MYKMRALVIYPIVTFIFVCVFVSPCYSFRCMDVPVSPHAILNPSHIFPPYNVGEILTFHCENGYGIRNMVPKATCTRINFNTSIWVYKGEECKSQCTNFPEFPNAHIIEIGTRKPPFHLEEKVSFRCNTGYRLRTFPEAVCKLVDDQASWILPEEKCKIMTCAAPKEVENAIRKGDDFTYGSKVTYVCNIGFEIANIDGTDTQTCNAEGTWEPKYQPFCKVLTCPGLPFPRHGYVRDYGKTYNTVAEYQCDGGYHIAGEKHRVCQGNKTWSGQEPTCVATICLSPGALENGKVYNLKDHYQTGEIIIYVCDNDEKRHSASCLKNGRWSKLPPLCNSVDSSENSSTSIVTTTTTPTEITTFLPKTDPPNDIQSFEEGGIDTPMIIGIAVGVTLLIIAAIVLAVLLLYCRRRRTSLSKKALTSDACYLGELKKLEKFRRY